MKSKMFHKATRGNTVDGKTGLPLTMLPGSLLIGHVKQSTLKRWERSGLIEDRGLIGHRPTYVLTVKGYGEG